MKERPSFLNLSKCVAEKMENEYKSTFFTEFAAHFCCNAQLAFYLWQKDSKIICLILQNLLLHPLFPDISPGNGGQSDVLLCGHLI